MLTAVFSSFNTRPKWPHSIVGALLALASVACSADTNIGLSADVKARVATPPAFVEGTDYIVLDKPVPTANSKKIEVVEMFWYGCSHCFHFEPRVQAWHKGLADDVHFHQTPAIWNGTMETHARAFYVAKTLGALDKTHDPMFNALNVSGKRQKVNTRRQIRSFYEDLGVSGDKFDKTWDSFWVNSQVNQAKQRGRAYQISGTPEIIVNGKYRVSSRSGGSHQRMLEVAEFLIEKERAELTQ